jgi:hypothetical protein
MSSNKRVTMIFGPYGLKIKPRLTDGLCDPTESERAVGLGCVAA